VKALYKSGPQRRFAPVAQGTDVLIVGGGIAGLSLASALAPQLRVALVEAEGTLGYHTSSRSARQLIPSYGPPVVQDLTVRTLELIRGFEQALPRPVLSARAFMLIGDESQVASKASGSMRPISHADALALCPQLAPDAFTAAGLDTTAVGADTDTLLDYHRTTAAAHGARILTGAPVTSIRPVPGAAGGWLVTAGSEQLEAAVVVNAAGAWADQVAAMAGAAAQGMQPYRRTAAIVQARHVPGPDAPMVAAADDTFYFRRDGEGAGVLISPCETVASGAEDAKPREGDLEALIQRLDSVTSLGIVRITRAWTGLRTEAPHGRPVIGFDPAVEGFFWLAGQGGYGFQTSSGIAELAAGLLTGAVAPDAPLAARLAPPYVKL
jgi:D-arginine dehydrogenase